MLKVKRMRKSKIIRIDTEIEKKMNELLPERGKSDFTNIALAEKLTRDQELLLIEKAAREVLKKRANRIEQEIQLVTPIPESEPSQQA